MNAEMEQFERLLKSQPLQHVPAEWRNEILAAANEAQGSRQRIGRKSLLSILIGRLVSLLWPHPVAWGALAAIWVFIVAVNISLREPEPVMAETAAVPSPQVVAELQQQRLLMAELLGPSDVRDADRPKTFVPKPRSECVEVLAA